MRTLWLISDCRCFGPVSGFVPQRQRLVVGSERGAKQAARHWSPLVEDVEFGPGHWGSRVDRVCDVVDGFRAPRLIIGEGRGLVPLYWPSSEQIETNVAAAFGFEWE
jgi:hypothetical protein